MAKRASTSGYRIEHDLLGTKRVPRGACYGIQTLRAMENFNISGVPLHHYPDFIRGLAMVKMAAARGNADVGALPKNILRGIEAACRRLIAGEQHDQFPVDMFQ